MSRYLIQTDKDTLKEVEHIILEEIIHRNRFIHEKEYMSTEELEHSTGLDTSIPIGNIPFVTTWLNKYHGISKENPIEIPKYIRTEEFLKREYKFVQAKDLPRKGRYFIKNVDTLKSFTYSGELEYVNIESVLEEPTDKFDNSLYIKPETLMLVSSIFDIQSEYRVYVINGQIETISNYNGSALVFPDVNLVNKAVELINYNEKWLKSYTLDIMVGPVGTAIIEVHNFTSVGLYNTLWGDNLLYAYKQGIEYLLNDNKKLEV